MEAVPDEPATWDELHPLLRDSWHRSATHLVDPVRTVAPIELDEADLRSYRKAHPLAQVLPALDELLVRPASEAGLIVAIGDIHGRLMWVDGDRSMLRRAERSAFQPGANWSEHTVGTNAPGLSLASGRGTQVRADEHFVNAAHQFSCSATPIRHPGTGELLGVVDITGGKEAVATHSLPLLYAAVSAAEGQLKTLQAVPAPESAQLRILGARAPTLTTKSGQAELARRHAEILLLLAWNTVRPGNHGLSAAELSELLYGTADRDVTLRAELVRLRTALKGSAAQGQVDILSRPYRLSAGVNVDAIQVEAALAEGDRDTALAAYQGQILPASEAPGIIENRRALSALLRESIVSDGTAQQLWHYLQLAESQGDTEAVYTALKLLPADSPQRAALVARMQP